MSTTTNEHGAATSAPGSLRSRRDELARALLAGELAPAAFPAAYAAAADEHLARLFAAATGNRPRGFALVAVGGYGRGQLCPGSDLDLVLIHRARRRCREVAHGIWYSLWDEGLRLDHSVRTRAEASAVAREDLKALLGLLDARVVAGDNELGRQVREDAKAMLRHDAGRILERLAESVAARHESAGELAFLLEPDLKQSAGGLRDAAALRAVRAALPAVGLDDLSPIAEAESLVTATRAALHCRTGSASDRLALQEQDQVASLLGFGDADALMAALAEAGRTIAADLEEDWHRVRLALRRGTRSEPPAPVAVGIVVREGEAALADDADLRDPALTLRLARVAAERHLLIETSSLDQLARVAHRPDEPWDAAVRDELVALLSTGRSVVPAIETLDRRRLFELFLPEWRAVRNRPQRNAYHRFTVDRHLLEAVAETSASLGRVDRPDLLVLGALLHDIGKGFPGDHSEVGREIAELVAHRLGFEEADAAVLGRIVAYHLVLPEFATRRDLDDPSTARVVARIVEDRRTLSLLAALAEADGQATGSAAWSPWKADLVINLVERVARVLDGHELPGPSAPAVPTALAAALATGRLGLHASGRHLTVVAPDRPGLLAAVTGVLALRGCNVLRASIGAAGDAMAVEAFDVKFAFGSPPDWSVVTEDLEAALAGRTPLADRLAEHVATYGRGRRPTAASAPQISIRLDDATSQRATILEVRAPDDLGLLHRIATVLADEGLDVAAALVDTLGHEVVDVFYIRLPSGGKLAARSDAATRLHTLLHEVLTHG